MTNLETERDISWGFLHVSVVKNQPAMQETKKDPNLILRLGRSPGGGNGNPLQYPCLKNPVDRGAWWATVHRGTKSWTYLSDCVQHTEALVRSSI